MRGFGLLPVKDEYKTKEMKNDPKTKTDPKAPPSKAGKQDFIRHVEDNIKMLLKAKTMAEKGLESGLAKFPRDESLIFFQQQLDNMFKTDCSKRRNEKTVSKNDRIASTSRELVNNDCKQEVFAVPLNAVPGTLPPVYYSPEFMEELESSEKKYIEDSKVRRTLEVIDPPDFDAETKDGVPNKDDACVQPEDDSPNFDFGISPVKDVPQQVANKTACHDSSKNKDKGKHVEVENQEERQQAQRRNIKLGDHLRSPFVVRCVELHLSTEDKRVNDWGIANFGELKVPMTQD